MATFFSRLALFDTWIQNATGRSAPVRGNGVYRCGRCRLLLFTSHTRFARGPDWASFWAPVCKNHVRIIESEIEGLERQELVCAGCQSHLGFFFEDGPMPTRRRFSITLSTVIFCPVKPQRLR